MSDGADRLIVSLDGFEGPLDLLLDLARKAKIDLRAISVSDLADQYLAYLEDVPPADLAAAADYLVMAAWLAYLKSRLLLPKDERAEDDPEALAEDLAWRLERLAAVRAGASWLAARPRLGAGRFARGAPDGLAARFEGGYDADLGTLMNLYGRMRAKRGAARLRVVPRAYMSLDAALERLSRLVTGREWQDLRRYLPPLETGPLDRAALAASFGACLELARQGVIEIEQRDAYAPLRVRRAP